MRILESSAFVRTAMERLNAAIESCYATAELLEDLDRHWLNSGNPVDRGDYEHGQRAVLDAIELVRLQLSGSAAPPCAKSDVLARLTVIGNCCKSCFAVNQEHLDAGKPFRCLVHECQKDST